MEDVNLDAGTGVDSPSESESTESNVQPEPQQEAQPPAEALNTEHEQVVEDSANEVPEGWTKGTWKRFKQESEKRKKAEELAKSTEARAQLYDTFEGALQRDPEFEKHISKYIEEKNAKVAQQQPDATGQQAQPQRVDPNIQALVTQNYLNSFENFARENNISEDQKAYVRQIAEVNLAKHNPYYLQNYNAQALDKALKDTKSFLDGFTKSTQASYVQNKTKATAPASSTGKQAGMAQKPSGPRDQHSRAKYIADKLKAANQIPASY